MSNDRDDEVLSMIDEDGLTTRELSEATGWPLGSSRLVLFRLYTQKLLKRKECVCVTEGAKSREFRFFLKGVGGIEDPEKYFATVLAKGAYA